MNGGIHQGCGQLCFVPKLRFLSLVFEEWDLVPVGNGFHGYLVVLGVVALIEIFFFFGHFPGNNDPVALAVSPEHAEKRTAAD